jgi:hypothetical protein
MKVEITQAPVAETEMLIRKPVLDVFEAFIDSLMSQPTSGSRRAVVDSRSVMKSGGIGRCMEHPHWCS